MSTKVNASTFSSSYYSSMNPSLEITEEKWVVSIAVEKKLFMHTILLIETIKKSERINYKAHLMAPGTTNQNQANKAALEDTRSPYCCWGTTPKVDIKKISNEIDPSRYETHYETWSIDWKQVQKMMDEITEEKEHPEKVNRPFHIFGEKSIFAPKKIVFDIYDEGLLEMREKEPEKFARMYAFYEGVKECAPPEDADYDDNYYYHNTPMKYPFKKAQDAFFDFRDPLLDNGYKEGNPGKILGGVLATIALYPAYIVVTLGMFVIDLPRMIYDDHEKVVQENKELFRLFEKHVEKLELASQNCFNWARCKLAQIDIKVGQRSSEWLTPVPTSYFSDKREIHQDNQN